MTDSQGSPWDFNDPADAERFRRELAEGAQVGEAVAGLRPSARALGSALLTYVDVVDDAMHAGAHASAQQRGFLGDDFDERFDEPPWMPVAGAPAEVEQSELIALGWAPEFLQRDYDDDYGRILYVVHRIADAAIDHLRAIGILIVDGRVIRPPLALARISLEASAQVVHLLQEQCSAAERVGQVLNAEILALAEERRVERKQRNSNEVRQLDREMKDLASYAASQGCARDKTDRSYIAPKIGPSVMIDRALTQNEYGEMWHVLSTFVHPLGDEGYRLLLGPTAPTERAHRVSISALHVLPAILVTISAHRAIARYTGWDLSAADKRADPLLELWTHGSGMRDDHYRSQLGVER